MYLGSHYRANKLAVTNEFIVIMLGYCLFINSDYVDDPE